MVINNCTVITLAESNFIIIDDMENKPPDMNSTFFIRRSLWNKIKYLLSNSIAELSFDNYKEYLKAIKLLNPHLYERDIANVLTAIIAEKGWNEQK